MNIRKIIQAFEHFLWPTHCLYCDSSEEMKSRSLCNTCIRLFELINPQDRCLVCFDDKECSLCRFETPPYDGLAYCFEDFNPFKWWMMGLQNHWTEDDLQGVAGFLVAQMIQLRWPFPDTVSSLPKNPISAFLDGDMDFDLAKLTAKLLNIESKKLFFKGKSIKSLKNQTFAGKTLLFVGVHLPDPHSLEQASKLLLEKGASKIYFLSLLK